MRIFAIEDEIHAESWANYPSFEAALEELERRAKIPWNAAPNKAPCKEWETCKREYILVEYEDANEPWQDISKTPLLEISAEGVTWMDKNLST